MTARPKPTDHRRKTQAQLLRLVLEEEEMEQEGVVGGELGLVVQSVCSGAELI